MAVCRLRLTLPRKIIILTTISKFQLEGLNILMSLQFIPIRTKIKRVPDFAFKEWKHEKFGYRQSTRIRKDPSVEIGVQGIDEDSPKPPSRFHISVEPTLCMAFGSCEVLAPKVFVLEKNKIINPKVRIVSEDGASFEDILSAAETCPTKAIRIIDRHSGEQVYP